MNKNHFLPFFLLVIFSSIAYAQTELRYAIVVNGGMFEFSPPYSDYVTVDFFEVSSQSVVHTDTIYTQAAQDILMDGSAAYVAASDSIIKYDLTTLERTAATGFGSISTIKLAVYDNLLLVGNWFGSVDNNLRIFDKNDLSFVDSIPEVIQGAKDMVIAGDTAYVQQNLSSTTWSDSAGYLAVIGLKNLEHVRDIQFSNAGEELGRLHVFGEKIIALNSNSNTITTYDISTGASSTDPVAGDIQVNAYGQQTFMLNDTLFFKFNNSLAALNLNSLQVIDSAILDSSITAIAFDVVNNHLYTTQTDFASYTRGAVYGRDGAFVDSLPVGFSPEAIALYYEEIIDGVNELAGSASFIMYPNPAIDKVAIDPDENVVYNWTLYGNTGLLIDRRTGLSGKQFIEVGKYPSGIYFLQIESTGELITKKIIRR